MSQQLNDWRTRAMLAGGIVGSLLGVGAAYLYIRSVDETGEPKQFSTREAVKLGTSLLRIVRQIADMGGR